MHVVIVGAGKLGGHLAELLSAEGHKVAVIDKDKARCRGIAHLHGSSITEGDGTEPKVLEKANAQKADAVIALTGNDETNLVVSLMARQLGAKSIATRLGKVEYDERVLQKLGIDMVIHPEAAAAGYIAELLTRPEMLDLAPMPRGAAEITDDEITAIMNLRRHVALSKAAVKCGRHPPAKRLHAQKPSKR